MPVAPGPGTGEDRPSTQAWESVLEPERRKAALAVARDVARRGSDLALIAEALAAAGRQTQYPETIRWVPYGVAEGDAGLALMCAAFSACRPQEEWDVTAHTFVAAAARSAGQTPGVPLGLFTGLSGLAFAVDSLSREGTRYENLLANLDAALTPQIAQIASSLLATSRPFSVGEFDVISGASGVGAYLLRRDSHRLLPEILSGLVSLTDVENGTPRWATPAHLLGDEAERRWYPWGNLNCGLAHGIPGVLALLALAHRADVRVPGQADAIRRLAEWLRAHRADDDWGVNWPTAVPLPPPEGSAAGPAELEPSRAAWCYGSPGVGRALWLAGDALQDEELCRLAIDAILAVTRRPVAERHIDSPTFCHGVAGLLQIVLRFANDTGHPAFRTAANDLVDQLLSLYDPARPLGFASLEPGPNPVDRAGLLDGAPGVAMVLLAAATDTEPTWDRLFLLS